MDVRCCGEGTIVSETGEKDVVASKWNAKMETFIFIYFFIFIF